MLVPQDEVEIVRALLSVDAPSTVSFSPLLITPLLLLLLNIGSLQTIIILFENILQIQVQIQVQKLVLLKIIA